MKTKIILPSLFVLNSFLVGFMPKASKAGSVEAFCKPKIDTLGYKLKIDSIYRAHNYHDIRFLNRVDSLDRKDKDSVSYNISWQGAKWVKYLSEDGTGFIRMGGSRTWRNMNAGALRYGPFSKQYGACGSAGGFAVFPTEESGMKALCALLRSEKYANLTIASAVCKYAPPSDHNNTRTYQQKLSKMTGLSLSKKIYQLTSDELRRVALAIKQIEGWKPGNSTPITKNIAKFIVLEKNQQQTR